jgi:hypothetical protein
MQIDILQRPWSDYGRKHVVFASYRGIISKSLRMLGFIKLISRDCRDPHTHKTLYISLGRPNPEHAACVWSPHQSDHSEWLERVQHNFIRYAVRRLPWRVWNLPAYDARCLLIGLEVLSDRRIVA